MIGGLSGAKVVVGGGVVGGSVNSGVVVGGIVDDPGLSEIQREKNIMPMRSKLHCFIRRI